MPTTWSVTAGAVISWALLSVISRILLLQFQLDPWSFSFLQLVTGGLLLLALSGGRGLAVASFRRPMTWVLGGLRVLSASIYTAVLAWLSVLEAGTVGAMSIPLVALAAWWGLGQRPARGEALGHGLILLAIGLLFLGLERELQGPVLLFMLLNALSQVLISILAERHPDNISDKPGTRLAFTGAVLLVTAGVFLVVRFWQGQVESLEWDGALLLWGALIGVTLRAPAMFLAFWSVRLIGARNYMAAVAFLPITGMVFEQMAWAAGLIGQSRFHPQTLALSLGVLAGSFVIFLARRRKAGSE
ncbi:hypothetical protein ACTL6U_06355 [Rhodovibrionaceae bacterium A322]